MLSPDHLHEQAISERLAAQHHRLQLVIHLRRPLWTAQLLRVPSKLWAICVKYAADDRLRDLLKAAV